MALLADQGHIDFTPVAASGGGDIMLPGFRAGGWALSRVLYVNNASAGNVTVTVNGKAHVLTPGISLLPVDSIYMGQPTNITYSAVASVTVAAVRLFDVP